MRASLDYIFRQDNLRVFPFDFLALHKAIRRSLAIEGNEMNELKRIKTR